jgi:hypothetical protein
MRPKSLFFFSMIALLVLNACSPFTIVSSSGEPSTPVESYDLVPTQEEAGPDLTLIPVEHVGVQIGVGSPMPVEIVASGTWPDLCAQIADVKTEINDFQIDITVRSSTAKDCPPDQLGLPFRFAIPLNAAQLEEGTYTITVNGTSNTLDWPPSRG